MLSLLLAVCLADPAVEPAVEAPATPKGAPPQLTVSSIRGGNLITTQVEMVPTTVMVKETVVKDGKTIEVAVTKVKYVPVMKETARDLKGATFTTAGGKKLTVEQATKRLAKPAGVVVSRDGNPVDAGWLALIKADVVVIALPADSGAGGGGIVPQPPPQIAVPLPAVLPPVVPPARPKR